MILLFEYQNRRSSREVTNKFLLIRNWRWTCQLTIFLSLKELIHHEEEGQAEKSDDVMNVEKGGVDTILSITETLECIVTESQLGGDTAAQEDDLLELD